MNQYESAQKPRRESDKKPRSLKSVVLWGYKLGQSSQLQPYVHKGMLSMNSSVLQKGPEVAKNTKLTDTSSTDITHYNLSYSSLHCGKLSQIEHLEINCFKIYPCKVNTPHSHKHCPFFHNNKDRKRLGNFYSAELCEYMEANQPCPYGDNCNKAHNRVEQLYRPDNYKTKFCTYYPNNIVNCEYGKFCSFAHSEEDISIELIHNLEYDDDFFMFYYKTVWCPYNLTQHDKALCVYAHNWQDFRRKPHIFQYQPIACQNWKTTDFITEYSDGCADAFNCTKCHGWKELEYHQMLFRTKQCLNQHCNKLDCSFFHSNSDKRAVNQHSQCRVFKIVPRNRIVRNTFKVRGTQKLTISQQQSQVLPQENMQKPMYLSQQRYDDKNYKYGEKCFSNFNFHSDSDWLGTNNAQNSSLSLDPDNRSEERNEPERKNPKLKLGTIQERTDSDEQIMRKRSFSLTIIEQHAEEHDNEQVQRVLNMIDLDG